MKRNFTKKVLSILMATVMMITVVPMNAITAFSAEDSTIKGAMETVYRNATASNGRKTVLNQNWKFNMTTADCYTTAYNDSSWSDVSLPHDFSIYQNFTTSGEAESGFLPGGTGWYRKKLVLPAAQAGKRFELNFDGSYMHTYVYVNGSYVGENHYGYNSFAFDITDKLTCDGSTENVIAVKVVHNTPSSRWYSGSGLYRSVTLVTTDPVHIAHNGLTITTPTISLGIGNVNVKAMVQNQSSSNANVTVKATIYEKGSDTAVATATSSAAPVNAGATSSITVAPTVASPKLWSLDNPNLYTAKIEVIKDGSTVDTYEDTFGFRFFSWSRTNGFSLNGTRVQLQGVCMHHDQGALGSAAYYDAMYRQMANMKNMGVNAIRATHNPYSSDFYKICDELGILVIEELFDGWAWAKNGNSNDFSSQWNVNLTASNTIIGGSSSMTWPEFVTKEVCQRDVNRPSVFMWSLCNELFEGANGGVSIAETYAQNIINWIKTVDTTRKFTCGDNNIKNGNSYYIAVDRVIANNGGIVGLNYCNSTQYSSIYNSYSDWIFYGAETASTTNSRDMYKSLSSNSAADSNRHITSYDTSAVGWGKTANDSMYTTLSNTFLAGEFRWTGWDYIGEPTPWNGTGTGQVSGGNGATPNSSYFGIVDTAGFEKDTYYLYRSQWLDKTDKITTHLVTAWDSNNYYVSGGKTPVFIYSNADKVELYLRKNGSSTDTLMGTATKVSNQTSVGAKYHQYNTTSNNSSECTATALNNSSGTSLYARFDLTYTAGTLFTKSYDGSGNLISTDRIEGKHSVATPGTATKIRLTQNKTSIAADGQSLAYFEAEILDANNNPISWKSNKINFSITGNGDIMGVDNGDQATTQKFQQSSALNSDRKSAQLYAYGGKALVVVRSTNDIGSFTVTASTDNNELTSDSCTVTTFASNDVEGGEFNNGDISSYSFVRNYTVKKGTAPTFDRNATANVVGSAEPVNGTITWSTVDSSKYSTVGDYTISGSVNFGAYGTFPVTCTLHVVDGIAGVQNIAVQTMKGEAPALPDVVNGLTSAGEIAGQFDVTWDEVNKTQFTTVGDIVEVNGTVSYFGTDEYPVKAFVRVVEPNVSSSSDITNTAYITSDVASGLNALRDGNITEKAWTNETNATSSDKAYIDFRWDTAVSLSSLDIAYYIDDNAVQPEDVEIQYSMDNVDYEAVGYTGPLSVEAGKLLHYALDETINPIAIRVVFTQQKRTSGECCVAVNEIKLNTETKSLPEASDSADLSSILVNGVAITGFNVDKLNYSSVVLAERDVVTATANDNVAITVIKNETNAVIVTLSENGVETKKYTVGNVVIPDVTTEVYKFDFKNSTPTTLETGSSLKTLTDNAGHTLNYMLWQASSVTTGQYLKIQDAFINTPSTIDTGIKGDCWNVVYRYNKTTADKPNATLIGLGTTGGSGSMADLIYITADGYVETGFTNTSSNQSTSVGKSLYDTSASSPEVLDIGYDNGIVTVKYNDETVFTKDISANETLNNKFKNGVGSFFIGANKYVSAGGTYSDTSHNSSGQAAYIQKLYDLTGTTTIKGSGGEVVEFESENIAPKATVTSNVSDSLTPLTDGNKEYSASNRVINWNVRSQGQMTVTFTWDKVYTLDYTNVDFYSEGWGTFPPKQFDIYVSTDGTTFSSSPIMSYTNDGSNIPSVSSSANVYEKKYEFPANTKAKAVKMVATVRDGSISSGKFATGFAEIEIFNKEQKTPVTPVDPEEPEETEEFVADTTAIDSAMRAFETKVASGKIYKNIYNAYSAYVECQKARDAAKYGQDSSVDLSAKASALTTATDAMTEWTMSMPTDISKVSARFSSYDNATSNKQYFKSALYITQNDDPAVVNNNPGHAWFGVYYHNGTYIYDGTNAIEVPVMLMTIPYKNPFYFFSAYLTGQNSAVSLKGRWFGSDGPGSGQARKYYYYHDEASLQSMSSDYYSRRFSFPSTSSYNNNSTYNDSKIGDLSGKSNWNLATTNTFVINGATLFPSGSKTVSTDVSMGTINMHTYNSTSLSSPWKNTYTLGTQIKVINQKGLKDRVTTYTEKFKNVANYKENGLNWAADGINRFANLDYNIVAQAAGTLTGDMTTAHNSFNSADTSTTVDSTAYASLRTALDSATATTNDNCYDDAKFEAYKTARANAIKAMKDVGASGYVGSNISDLATTLNSANAEMKASSGAHIYSAGVYDSSTNEITYTCTSNKEHTLVVDAGAYSAAVEELQANLAEAKFKTQAIKNCEADIAENGYFGLINGTSVSKFITQADLDNIVSAIATLKTELNKSVNIKRFDISYVYQKNEETILNGIAVDSRYGDWLSESYYVLGKNENVYKWTITDANGTTKTTNKSTGLNVRADRNMQLACYISDGSEVAQDNQHKVTFVSKAGKIAGVEFLDANTTLTVDGDTVKDSQDNVVFKAPKIPFYQVMGFKVGSTSYVTSNTISVTRDLIIAPVYEPQSTFRIYTSGENVSDVTINGEREHNSARNAYQANWDQRIELDIGAGKGVYWYINGNLVGYGVKYTFRATCDATITVSSTATDNSPTAYLSYFNYDAELNRVTAVVNFYSEGGTVTSAGVILSTKDSTEESVKANGKKFSSSNFTGDGNQVRISVSRTANTAFNMYAVPYVVVNGVNGTDYYYGDMVTLNYIPS